LAGLLTSSSVLMCPHGGPVQIISANSRAKATDPLACSTDTFVITGCPFVIAGAPHPCVTIQWITTATRCQAGGQPLLNESSVGLCLAPDQTPQGPVQIVSVQPRATGQ
jgi:hypothetical protein